MENNSKHKDSMNNVKKVLDSLKLAENRKKAKLPNSSDPYKQLTDQFAVYKKLESQAADLNSKIDALEESKSKINGFMNEVDQFIAENQTQKKEFEQKKELIKLVEDDQERN